MANLILTRRRFLTTSAAGASSLMLAGCDQFDFMGQRNHPTRTFFDRANSLTYHARSAYFDDGRRWRRTIDSSEIRQAAAAERLDEPAERRISRDGQGRTTLPTTGSDVAGLVDNPLAFTAWTSSATCRGRARSPGTTASRAGAASPSGRERGSGRSSIWPA